MAAPFVLTAEIRLRPPRNIRGVVRNMQQQLAGVKANVDVKVPKGAAQNLDKISKNVKSVGTSARTASKHTKNFGQALKGTLGYLVRYDMARMIINAVTQTIRESTKAAIDFEREMVKVSQVTGTSMKSLSGLQKEITKLSTTMGVSSANLVKTAKTLAQTGMTADDVRHSLEALAKTTLAPTFDDIKNTTETAIAAMRQFGIEAKHLERELGRINALAANFAVEASDIGVAIRRAGGAFKAAGGNLQELNSLFTAVRSTTRETAETIATGFRTIFTRMQRPKTIQFMRQLGVELQNVEGHFVGPYEAVRKLNVALKGLDPRDVRYSQIVEQLGGFRQVSKVIPLIQQFNQAQKALTVSQAGGKSLTEDAAKAQQALAVQLQKVRQEFEALFRELMASKGFQSMIKGALELSRAVIKITDAIAPLLPMLATIGAAKLVALGAGKGMAARGKAEGGRVHAFARGGMVPGTGNRDTVPAMLTPGEFVIKKSSVKKLGPKNLQRVNRYVDGGTVKFGDMPRRRMKAHTANPGDVTWEKEKGVKFGSRRKQHKFNKTDTLDYTSHREKFPTLKARSKIKRPDDRLLIEQFYGEDAFASGNAWEEILRGGLAKGAKLKGGRQQRFGGSAPLDGMWGKMRADAARSSTSHNKKGLMGDKLAADEITFGSRFKTRKMTREDNTLKASPSLELIAGFTSEKSKKSVQGAAAQKSEYITARGKRKGKFRLKAKGGNISGAGTDTVPALLTPGEFVINRSSSARIGYGNLERMNTFGRFAAGGQVQKFNKGTPRGGVKKTTSTDTGDGDGGGGGGGMAAMALMMAIPLLTDHIKKQGKEYEQLGRQFDALMPILTGAGLGLMLFGTQINTARKNMWAMSKGATALVGAFGLVAAGAYAWNKARQQEAKDRAKAALTNLEGNFKTEAAIEAARKDFVSGKRDQKKEEAAGKGMMGLGALGTVVGTVAAAVLAPEITLPALAIGAVAGGTLGGVGGHKLGSRMAGKDVPMDEFNAKLKSLQLEASLESFAASLKLVSEGKASPRSQAAAISVGLDKLTAAFASTATADAMEDLNGKVKKSIPTLTAYILKLEESTKSFDELQAIVGKKTLRQFAQLSGFSLDDMAKRIDDNIEIRKKAAAAQREQLVVLEQMTKQMRFARDTISAFALVERRLKAFDTVLDSTSQSIRNSFGPAAMGQLSPAFADLSKIVDMSVFRKQVDLVASVFGEAGVSLGEELKQIADVSSSLPGVLIGAVNDIGIAGDNAGDIIVDRLDSAGVKMTDAMKRQLRSRISALSDTGEGGVGKFRGKIQKDLDGTVKEIMKGMTESAKAFQAAAKFVDGAGKRMAKAFDMRTKLEVDMAKKQASIIGLMAANFKRIQAAKGRPTGLGFEEAIFDQQQNALLQGTKISGFGGNLQIVSAEFLRLKDAIARSNKRLAEFGLEPGMAMGNLVDSQKALINENAKLKEQFAKTNQALQNYTNIQQRVGIIQKRIAEEAQKRQTMLNSMSQFAFGTDKQRFDMMKAFRATTIAVGKGLHAIPQDMRPAVMGVLDQFKNIRIFGGKTGSEAKASLTIREMERLFGKMPDGIKKQIMEATQQEQGLISQMARLQKEAERAQKTLLEGMEKDRKSLNTDLKDLHRELVDGLHGIFLRQEEKQLKQGMEEAKQQGVSADKGVKAINTLQKMGIDVRDEDNLNALRDNIGVIKASRDARERWQKLQRGRVASGAVGGFEAIDPKSKEPGNFESRLNQVREALVRQGTGADVADQIVQSMRTRMQSMLVTQGGAVSAGDLNIEMKKAFSEAITRMQGEQTGIAEESHRVLKRLGLGRIGNILIRSEEAFNKVTSLLMLLPDGSSLSKFDEQVRATTTSIAESQRRLDANMRQQQNITDRAKAAKGKATGGVVYAAGGTFVPQGTDTVPAMLTPGEFVVNKKAASKNMGILSSINSGGTQYFAGGGAVIHAAGPTSPVSKMRSWKQAGKDIPDSIVELIRSSSKATGIHGGLFDAVAGGATPWGSWESISKNSPFGIGGLSFPKGIIAAAYPATEPGKAGVTEARSNFEFANWLTTVGAGSAGFIRPMGLPKHKGSSDDIRDEYRKLKRYIGYPPYAVGQLDSSDPKKRHKRLADSWAFWIGENGSKSNSIIEQGIDAYKTQRTPNDFHTATEVISHIKRDTGSPYGEPIYKPFLDDYTKWRPLVTLSPGLSHIGTITKTGTTDIGKTTASLDQLSSTLWGSEGWKVMLPKSGKAQYLPFEKLGSVLDGGVKDRLIASAEGDLFGGGGNMAAAFEQFKEAEKEYTHSAGKTYANWLKGQFAHKDIAKPLYAYYKSRGSDQGPVADPMDWDQKSLLLNNLKGLAIGPRRTGGEFFPFNKLPHQMFTDTIWKNMKRVRKHGVNQVLDFKAFANNYGPGGGGAGVFSRGAGGRAFDPTRWPNSRSTDVLSGKAWTELSHIEGLWGSIFSHLDGTPAPTGASVGIDAFTQKLEALTDYLGIGRDVVNAPRKKAEDDNDKKFNEKAKWAAKVKDFEAVKAARDKAVNIVTVPDAINWMGQVKAEMIDGKRAKATIPRYGRKAGAGRGKRFFHQLDPSAANFKALFPFAYNAMEDLRLLKGSNALMSASGFPDASLAWDIPLMVEALFEKELDANGNAVLRKNVGDDMAKVVHRAKGGRKPKGMNPWFGMKQTHFRQKSGAGTTLLDLVRTWALKKPADGGWYPNTWSPEEAAFTEGIFGRKPPVNVIRKSTIDMWNQAKVAKQKPVKKASGGLIRMAAGGMFAPHGTDTVPAMLTPGEFVVKKSAVDNVGVGFLQSINDSGGKGGGRFSTGGPVQYFQEGSNGRVAQLPKSRLTSDSRAKYKEELKDLIKREPTPEQLRQWYKIMEKREENEQAQRRKDRSAPLSLVDYRERVEGLSKRDPRTLTPDERFSVEQYRKDERAEKIRAIDAKWDKKAKERRHEEIWGGKARERRQWLYDNLGGRETMEEIFPRIQAGTIAAGRGVTAAGNALLLGTSAAIDLTPAAGMQAGEGTEGWLSETKRQFSLAKRYAQTAIGGKNAAQDLQDIQAAHDRGEINLGSKEEQFVMEWWDVLMLGLGLARKGAIKGAQKAMGKGPTRVDKFMKESAEKLAKDMARQGSSFNAKTPGVMDQVMNAFKPGGVIDNLMTGKIKKPPEKMTLPKQLPGNVVPTRPLRPGQFPSASQFGPGAQQGVRVTPPRIPRAKSDAITKVDELELTRFQTQPDGRQKIKTRQQVEIDTKALEAYRLTTVDEQIAKIPTDVPVGGSDDPFHLKRGTIVDEHGGIRPETNAEWNARRRINEARVEAQRRAKDEELAKYVSEYEAAAQAAAQAAEKQTKLDSIMAEVQSNIDQMGLTPGKGQHDLLSLSHIKGQAHGRYTPKKPKPKPDKPHVPFYTKIGQSIKKEIGSSELGQNVKEIYRETIKQVEQTKGSIDKFKQGRIAKKEAKDVEDALRQKLVGKKNPATGKKWTTREIVAEVKKQRAETKVQTKTKPKKGEPDSASEGISPEDYIYSAGTPLEPPKINVSSIMDRVDTKKTLIDRIAQIRDVVWDNFHSHKKKVKMHQKGRSGQGQLSHKRDLHVPGKEVVPGGNIADKDPLQDIVRGIMEKYGLGDYMPTARSIPSQQGGGFFQAHSHGLGRGTIGVFETPGSGGLFAGSSAAHETGHAIDSFIYHKARELIVMNKLDSKLKRPIRKVFQKKYGVSKAQMEHLWDKSIHFSDGVHQNSTIKQMIDDGHLAPYGGKQFTTGDLLDFNKYSMEPRVKIPDPTNPSLEMWSPRKVTDLEIGSKEWHALEPKTEKVNLYSEVVEAIGFDRVFAAKQDLAAGKITQKQFQKIQGGSVNLYDEYIREYGKTYNTTQGPMSNADVLKLQEGIVKSGLGSPVGTFDANDSFIRSFATGADPTGAKGYVRYANSHAENFARIFESMSDWFDMTVSKYHKGIRKPKQDAPGVVPKGFEGNLKNTIKGLQDGTIHSLAAGGIVPMAGGGSIFAQGTDTVPAMLTPGEFVVSKKAVDQVGVGFLKGVNSGKFAAGGMVQYFAGGSPVMRMMGPDGGGVPGHRLIDSGPDRFTDEMIKKEMEKIQETEEKSRKLKRERWMEFLREPSFDPNKKRYILRDHPKFTMGKSSGDSYMRSGGLVSYFRHGGQADMAYAHDYSEMDYAREISKGRLKSFGEQMRIGEEIGAFRQGRMGMTDATQKRVLAWKKKQDKAKIRERFGPGLLERATTTKEGKPRQHMRPLEMLGGFGSAVKGYGMAMGHWATGDMEAGTREAMSAGQGIGQMLTFGEMGRRNWGGMENGLTTEQQHREEEERRRDPHGYSTDPMNVLRGGLEFGIEAVGGAGLAKLNKLRVGPTRARIQKAIKQGKMPDEKDVRRMLLRDFEEGGSGIKKQYGKTAKTHPERDLYGRASLMGGDRKGGVTSAIPDWMGRSVTRQQFDVSQIKSFGIDDFVKATMDDIKNVVQPKKSPFAHITDKKALRGMSLERRPTGASTLSDATSFPQTSAMGISLGNELSWSGRKLEHVLLDAMMPSGAGVGKNPAAAKLHASLMNWSELGDAGTKSSLKKLMSELGDAGTNIAFDDIPSGMSSQFGAIDDLVNSFFHGQQKKLPNMDPKKLREVIQKTAKDMSELGDAGTIPKMPDKLKKLFDKSSIDNATTKYKASGGSIFTPQGTDTVPAMLTPGEFVIQKAAVDALGTSFLNAINSVSSKSSKPRGFKKGGGVEYLQHGGQKGPGSPITLDSSKFDRAVQNFSTAIDDLKGAFKGGFAFSHTGTINIVVSLDDTATIFSAAKGSFESIAADKVAEGVNSALKEHFPDLPRSTFQGDISPAGGMGTV